MNKVIVGAIVLAVIIIGLVVGAFFIGQTLVDILLIIAALFSLIAFALLGYAALQIVGLIKEVRGEAQTVIGTARETMTEVQGTARFVGDTVVSPVAQAAGFVSAARAIVKSFTEPLFKRG